MQIFVRCPTGRTICLRVLPLDTLSAIKAKIQEQHLLVFDGGQLDDNRTLADYDIQHKSTLDLQEKMQIHVSETLGRAMTLQVDSSDTIDKVKAKIQDAEGFSKSQQCLIFGKKQLTEDKRTLADHNISMDSTLLLVLHPFPRGSMEIFVKMDAKTLTLCVETSETVDNVKVMIYMNGSFPPKHQRLIFAGRQLESGRTLADYNIHNDSTIHVLGRLCCC